MFQNIAPIDHTELTSDAYVEVQLKLLKNNESSSANKEQNKLTAAFSLNCCRQLLTRSFNSKKISAHLESQPVCSAPNVAVNFPGPV